MLDLTIPWATFGDGASAPGLVGRIGPITAEQARALAAVAATGTGSRWRVILISDRGRALRTARVTLPRKPGRAQDRTAPDSARPSAAGLPEGVSLIGRVTVTIPVVVLDGISPAEMAGTGIRVAVLRTAARAAAQARGQAAADRATAGGCAHATSSGAYRPPPRIRELVDARDQTCRFPSCGQSAWRGDLDHTHPFDQGGLTCPCNLGPLCRRHHRLKQQAGWSLTQPSPGAFRWTTPAGRHYHAGPQAHHS